jgi:hypothetical protein
MSDEPKSKDGGWNAPEPVFRSTQGRTPRTAKGYIAEDDIDTAAPDFREVDTDEFDTEPMPFAEVSMGGEIGSEPTATPRPTPTPAPPPSQSGGCLSTLLTMLGVATFLFAVLIAIALYFLMYYTPRSTTF